MRESSIEKKIVAFAKQQGCLTFKFTSPGQKGVPDRCIISPYGSVLFMEVKAPGKKPTALQLQTIKKLRSHNLSASWTDSGAQGIKMIERFLESKTGFESTYHSGRFHI